MYSLSQVTINEESLYNEVLNTFDKIDVDLVAASNILKSSIEFVKNLRGNFNEIENQSKNISEFVIHKYAK